MTFSNIKILSFFGALIFCVLAGSSVAYATHGAGNCCNGGQAGEHTNSPCGGAICPGPAPVVQYYACTLSFDKPVIQAGTPSLRVSWLPVVGTGSLKRAATVLSPITAGMAYFDDTSIGALPPGTYSFTAAYSAGLSYYNCSQTLTVVSTLTECNDGIDNNDTEDALIDAADPACHTDGDSSNAVSYNGLLPSETNAPANLVASVKNTGLLVTGSRIYIHGSIKNTASINTANVSDRIIVWRKIGTTCAAVSGAQPCISYIGNTYIRIYSGAGLYAPRYGWSTDTSFIPGTSGSYEVCILSDTQNVVFESNESDNVSCMSFAVTDPSINAPLSVGVSLRTQYPQGPWINTLLVSPRQKINLAWQPSANAVSCVSLTPALFMLPATRSNIAGTVAGIVAPTSGSQVYTVECTDAVGDKARGSATATVRGAVTGPLTLTMQPTRVRKGTPAKIVWNTGGRAVCAISGSDNESITVPSVSGSKATAAITAPTVFTISCLDDGSEVSATVNLIPSYQEI